MFNSLRSRLIASYILIVVVCLLLVGISLLFFIRSNSIVERIDVSHLTEVARTALRPNTLPAGISVDELNRLATDVAAANEVRVMFVDESGRVAVDSAVLSNEVPAGDIPQVELRPNAQRGVVRDAANQTWIYISRPAGPPGWQGVLALQRTTPLQFLRENFLTPLVQAAAVGVVLSVIMALLIAQWVATPLQKASAAAAAITHGKFDQPVPVSGPTEVRSLAKSFNEMTARVNASLQARRDFVANVSHELKTPLTSIQGFSQAILDGAAADPEAVRRAATIINDEADRMRRSVEGLLDLARLDAGQSALHREPTDLATVLTSMTEKLSLRAAEKKIVLRAQIDPLPSMVADPDRLAQVFANLLDNALKYTPSGGTVTLTAKLEAGWATVAVTDTGSGIPVEDLPHIFERFYRVEKSKAAGRGYGLGLAITKEIVQAHGGAISAESVSGLGTKFTVRLPLAQSDDTTVARKRPGLGRQTDKMAR
ncbi:MAG: HAMP domain-containing histidine kinase [Chloroflexi bacterium]|nr:HAMP domain-containing histidine kinase [Chloroflexota bacterium]